jgi:hypothetical protein
MPIAGCRNHPRQSLARYLGINTPLAVQPGWTLAWK